MVASLDHVDAGAAAIQLAWRDPPLDLMLGHPVFEQLPERDDTVLRSAEPADEAL